jgi:hypothetical protein
LEKPPLKTAITDSKFLKFDDLEVIFLRLEMGVLLDNLSRVYNVVSGKAAAKAKDTEDNANSKTTGEEKEEKDLGVTTLSQFVEENRTNVIYRCINPQIASKGLRGMFKELF